MNIGRRDYIIKLDDGNRTVREENIKQNWAIYEHWILYSKSLRWCDDLTI